MIINIIIFTQRYHFYYHKRVYFIYQISKKVTFRCNDCFANSVTYCPFEETRHEYQHRASSIRMNNSSMHDRVILGFRSFETFHSISTKSIINQHEIYLSNHSSILISKIYPFPIVNRRGGFQNL